MPSRRQGLRIRYSQRRLFQEINSREQRALAIVVHKVLVRAGYRPLPDVVRGENEKGFGVWVLRSLNSDTSVSVVSNPNFTLNAAVDYANSIVTAFRTVIGEAQAKQIVRVVPRRLPVRDMIVLDAQGGQADLNYMDVTVEIPPTPSLRALYTKLGR